MSIVRLRLAIGANRISMMLRAYEEDRYVLGIEERQTCMISRKERMAKDLVRRCIAVCDDRLHISEMVEVRCLAIQIDEWHDCI